MKEVNKTGIVVQARMGSSRLPGKMGRRFSNGKSLLEIVLDRLISLPEGVPVVVATTGKSADDYIERTSRGIGVSVFRGSEEDVMARFIGAAEQNGLKTIIRICADNPFIQTRYVRRLINYNEDLSADYVGFRLNGVLPAIKTHLGFFPERVELEALKSIHDSGINSNYREHVTNYFYSDDNESIPVEWIDLDFPEEFVKNRRFTIDTAKDFEIAENIYKHLRQHDKTGTVDEIFEYVESNPDIVTEMKKSIIENEK